MKSTIFWDITLCSQLKVVRHFRGIYCLHLQGQINRARYQCLATCFHAGIFLGLFDPKDGGDMFL
jgi:hypothetical protein